MQLYLSKIALYSYRKIVYWPQNNGYQAHLFQLAATACENLQYAITRQQL